MQTITGSGLTILLNQMLKQHESYEDWMQFDSAKNEGGNLVVHAKKTPPPESNLSTTEIDTIYNETVDKFIP